MPIVNVTTWPTEPDVKRKLIDELTRTVHEVTKAPLDKITVYIQEISPSDWGEAGAIGDSPDFREKSRRLSYES